MGRNRKDSQGDAVDNYRRNIGKQDVHKSKSELKEVRKRAQLKENAPATYKNVTLMVGALGIIVACVYFLFYMLMKK